MNGNILRKLRKEHGLTQRELADMADVHITTIKRIENGATTQSHAPNIRKLAKAFGVAPDYLLQEITPTLTGLNHFFGTIPAQLIGRQDELDTVNRALSSPNGPQVITLTGHRGVGKTAIASTVAQKAQSILGFQSVIWTSGKSEELEPRGITRVGAPPLSPADITHAIGAAFGQDNIGIHPLTEQEHIAINLLSKQPVLLVVDNLDGLSKDDLDLLASFMQRLPYNTRVLATGLCPLGIKNEAIVRISPLSVEDACVLVSREAALKQVELSSTDALAIYKSVGGIPVLLIWCVGRMALESQSTEIVLHELAESNTDAYEWCFARIWEMLPSEECRALLIAASMCVNSADRTFLGIISGITVPRIREHALSQLASRASLLSYDPRSDRYSMLPLTRSGALKQLRTMENSEAIWLQAIDYFTQIAASYGDDPNSSWSKVDVEIENILGLAEWCCLTETWEPLARLLYYMDQYLYIRSRWNELRRYVEAVLENAGQVNDKTLIAHLQRDIAWIYMEFGENAKARAYAMQAHDTFQKVNNARLQSICLRYVAQILIRQQQYVEAKQYLRRSAKEANRVQSNEDLLSVIDNLHGCIRLEAEDYSGAERYFLRALRRKQNAPTPDKFSICAVLRNLGELAMRQGNHVAAARRLQRCLNLCQEISRKDLEGGANLLLAELRASQGNNKEAYNLVSTAIQIFTELGLHKDLARAQTLVAELDKKQK